METTDIIKTRPIRDDMSDAQTFGIFAFSYLVMEERATEGGCMLVALIEVGEC